LRRRHEFLWMTHSFLHDRVDRSIKNKEKAKETKKNKGKDQPSRT